MDLQIENWARVPSNVKEYWVSDQGRFKFFVEKTERISNGFSNSLGYKSVSITSDTHKHEQVLMHRLVAIYFIPNPLNLPQVNHKNGIRSDNRVENLEWCNNSQNNKHAFDILNRKPTWLNTKGDNFFKRNSSCKLCHQYDLMGNLIQSFPGAREAERITGVSHKNISQCATGKNKTAGGFIWKNEANPRQA